MVEYDKNVERKQSWMKEEILSVSRSSKGSYNPTLAAFLTQIVMKPKFLQAEEG